MKDREAQRQEQLAFTAESTKNKQNTMIKEFSSFNSLMEGDRGAFYNPGKGTSGWTVGQGIDIGQMTREDAVSLGMPRALVDIADKHKAWGVQGKKVPKTVQKMAFDMESEEWKNFGNNVARTKLPVMEKIATDNPNLSSRAVVALAQVDHWTGGVYNRTNEASKLNRSEKSLKTDGRQTSTTENLINPLANLLESGNATDEGVREVLALTQKSYGTGRPLNSTTMGRYLDYLEQGT